MKLNNSTLINNAGSGIWIDGWIYGEGPLALISLASTIIASNEAEECVVEEELLIEDQGSNWVEDDSCGLTGRGDPGLTELGPNGSQIRAGAPGSEEVVSTHGLTSSSPVLNQGSNPEGLATDQRGLPRDVNGVDIGSYELQ